MTRTSKSYIASCALALLVATGCGTRQSETDKKIAELQAQLEQQKKELDQAKAPEQPAAGAIAASKGASAQGGSSSKPAMDANKAAIASNRDAIDFNAAGIEKNRQSVEEAKQMAAPAPYHTILAGARISVRTGPAISTKTSSTGALFEATLTQPLTVDGYLVAGAGATVDGVVSNSDPGGKVKGVASISVALRSITMADGRKLPIKTGSATFDAKKSTKKDAMKVGIGAGIGAAIGAIAGGGKGAAIGAAAGGGGGTALVLATKGDPAVIPAETVLTLALSSDVRFQELK